MHQARKGQEVMRRLYNNIYIFVDALRCRKATKKTFAQLRWAWLYIIFYFATTLSLSSSPIVRPRGATLRSIAGAMNCSSDVILNDPILNRQTRALSHGTSLAVIGPDNGRVSSDRGSEILSTAGDVDADAQTSAQEHMKTHAAKGAKRHPEHVVSGGIRDSRKPVHATTTDAAEIAKVMQLVAMLEKLWNLHDRCTRNVATADHDLEYVSIKSAIGFAHEQLYKATASSSEAARRLAIANGAGRGTVRAVREREITGKGLPRAFSS